MRAVMLIPLLSLLVAATATAGDDTPAGWHSLPVANNKPVTRYVNETVDGRAVIHAIAHSSASILAEDDPVDLNATPVVSWSWRVNQGIAEADNSVASKEDSPARLVFAFDGDVSKLPLRDRTVIGASKAFSEYPLPYATLKYVWNDKLPPGTLISNPHTRRIQMIVVSGGAGSLGRWLSFKRNVREDFRRAFGEEPGRLLAWGLMTDSDNTQSDAEAWYGAVKFAPAP